MQPISLFLHSTGAFPSMWRHLPERITSETQVLRPANLGYAPNPAIARSEAIGFEEDVQHHLSRLPAEGLIDLYGHSYGGLLALRLLAELGPRVRSIFLFEPVMFGELMRAPDADPKALEASRALGTWQLSFTPETGGNEAWLQHFIDYWNRPGTWERSPSELKDALRKVGWKMYNEVQSVMRHDHVWQIPRLPKQSTLVMGERSPYEARSMVLLLKQRNPEAVLVDLEKGSHMSAVTDPERMKMLLEGHAERVYASF